MNMGGGGNLAKWITSYYKLMLFRHSAMSLAAQEEHLLHAIVVKLRVHKADIVMLTPGTAGSICV